MRLFRQFFLGLLLITGAVSQSAANGLSPLSNLFSDQPSFLPVEQAFQFDFEQQDGQLLVKWDIAPGYYLYKKQFKVVTKGAELGEPEYPAHVQVEDEYYGISDAFRHSIVVRYPIISSQDNGLVKIRYQGCADKGFCYLPDVKQVYLNEYAEVTNKAITPVPFVDEPAQGPTLVDDTTQTNPSNPVSEQFELASLLSSEQGLLLTLALFLALGVGLAFTPCVFPMYPILSGIVIGQGKQISTSRAFSLSFIYVQGMAITYSLLGLIVASAGVQFQAALQHPIILGTLILVFVALALVMFGAYELQLPSSWQQKLNDLSNKQTSGSYFGVFAMGAISGLVASPCTTAPLTGILLYIAQSGDLLLGFSALYALSLGMGVPLILFGITGGKLLPKAGHWMNVVKVAFGFMMLAVAIMFIERMLVHPATDIAWSLLGLSAFSYFYVMNQDSAKSFFKGLRIGIIFVGLFVSVGYGYSTLNSMFNWQSGAEFKAEHTAFVAVEDLDDFEQKLTAANAQGKFVMIDLYADWCVACKHFEKYTFPHPSVTQALAGTELMQIDLTDVSDKNQEFQQHFDVLGLPTIMFFGPDGKEIRDARVTGFMDGNTFAQHLERVLRR